MSGDLKSYLDEFERKAAAAGLEPRAPGKNWIALPPLVRGSHVSLSVGRHQIQVNLNNDEDADRARIDALNLQRDQIHDEVGEGLSWEKKEGRKKTAVRATRDSGYEDADHDDQHDWALRMMKAFQTTFGRRLG